MEFAAKMKYLEVFACALWGLFLISEVAGSPYAEHYPSPDEAERNIYEASRFNCPFWYGTFSDPQDCSKYYMCMNGMAIHKKCDRKKHFDVWRRVCLPIFIAVCGTGREKLTTKYIKPTPKPTTTTSIGGSFKCPSIFGSFPDPKDCSKYYVCLFYRHTHITCGKNELFDADTEKCKPEKGVTCGDRPRPLGFTTTPVPTESTTMKITTITIPTETVTEISTETPTEVIVKDIITDSTTETATETPTESPTTESTTETPTESPTTESTTETPTESPTTESTTETTPETPTESPTTESTTFRPTGPPEHDCDENDVDCIIDETGDANDWFICPQDVGAYAHPSSDKLFIFCMNWIPSVKKCGMDLAFSKELSTCIESKF